MRYHHKKPYKYSTYYGEIYICDHPIYNRCTLYKIGNKGLSIVQQRFDPINKTTKWTEIDPWLTDILYLNENFISFFKNRAGNCINGLYPTVTIR